MKLSNFSNSGFDRGAPRWRETLWWLVRSLFFAGWLPLPSGLRAFFLRAFGAQIGKNVVIRSRVNISFPWRLKCGNHVWIGEEVNILSLAEVRIEDNVCISQQTFVCTGSHDFRSENFDLITRPITIGCGSWIGARTFIGPGVQFGKNSRSLAGAVVVKSVAAGVTVGGVPAAPQLTL